MPVRVPGADQDLQRIFRLEDGSRGKNFQPFDAGVGRLRPRSAGGDPVRQHLVIRRIHFDLLSAAMGHGERRLAQEQTAHRLLPIDPPAQRLPGQHEMIGLRIIAAQR